MRIFKRVAPAAAAVVLLSGVAAAQSATQDLSAIANQPPAVPLAKLLSGPALKRTGQLDGALKELLAASLAGKAAVPAKYLVGSHKAYGELFLVHSDGNPVVEIVVRGDLDAAAAQLRAMKGVNVLGVASTKSYGLVSAAVTPARLTDVAAVPGVQGINASQAAAGGAGKHEKIGTWPSQAVQRLRVDRLQAYFPQATGTGIRIGILSDSVNQRDSFPGDGRIGIDESQNTADLPPDNRIWVIQDGNGGTDEGRAMMEHVYDIAPDAQFYGFATAFGGEATFAQNIAALRTTAGMHIICDDIGYLGEPMYEDGPVADAVNTHTDTGIYFALAGNTANVSYQAVWNDANGNDLHDYAPGREGQLATIPAGMTLQFGLQWSQRWGQATTDLELEITDAAGVTVLARSNVDNIANRNPYENASLANTTSNSIQVLLRVRRIAGDANGLTFKYMPNVNTAITLDEYPGNAAGTQIAHAGTLRSISIGAAPQSNVNTIEAFSSLGPHRRFFGDVGIDEQTFQKPDFVGVDGCSTSFFGGGPGLGFFGTSAATPNVAAVGALCLQLAGGPGSLSQSQMRTLLRSTAEERGTPFFDTTWGFGFVNALGAGLLAAGPQPVTDWIIPSPRGIVDKTITLPNASTLVALRYPNAGNDTIVSSLEDIGSGGFVRPMQMHFAENTRSMQALHYSPSTEPSKSSVSYYAGAGSPTHLLEIATLEPFAGPRNVALKMDLPDFPIQTWTPDGDGIVSGFVNSAAPVVYYEVPIPADAGLFMTIEASTEDFDIAVAAFTAFYGRELGFADNAGGGESLRVRVPSYDTGFHVAVAGKRYESFGRYALRVSYESFPGLPRSTEFGAIDTRFHENPVTGTIEMFGDHAAGGASTVFAFHPQMRNVKASVPGTIPADVPMSLGIYDINQTRGPAVGDTIKPTVEGFTNPLPSYFMYAVTGPGTPATQYGLNVEMGPLPAPALLTWEGFAESNTYEALRSGSLNYLGEADAFRFVVPGTNGQTAITAYPKAGSESLDIAFRVLDASGLEVAPVLDNSPAGFPESFNGTLTPGATYWVQVFGKPRTDSSYADNSQRGAYDVGFTVAGYTPDAAGDNGTPAQAFDISGTPGSWSDETLGQFVLTDTDYFRFTLGEGQDAVTIYLRAFGQTKGAFAPPHFRLLREDGTVIAESTDTGGYQGIEIPRGLEPGDYLIEVIGDGSGTPYSLIYIPFEGPPGPLDVWVVE